MSVKSTTTYYGMTAYSRGHSVKDTDLAANMTIIDSELYTRLAKLSTTTVAFNSATHTTLYTVPIGKVFVPVFVVVRAGADASTSAVTFGRSTALTDWLGTTTLSNLDAAGDQVKIEVVPNSTPVKSKTYAAGVIFQIDVTTANGGATNYVDLFGYLIDA
jgi:hypothetical protein